MRAEAFLCLALAGCASTPRVEVQRVEVPVAVACVAQADIPSVPANRFAGVSPEAPIDDQVKALLLDRYDHLDYVGRASVLLDVCATGNSAGTKR